MKKHKIENNDIYDIEKDNFYIQVQENLGTYNFEEDKIQLLIVEFLTKLTGKTTKKERYIDSLPIEEIHQYIHSLEKLYKLKQVIKKP